jgi:hypothetical protein
MKTLQTSGILTNEKHFTAHQKKNYADPWYVCTMFVESSTVSHFRHIYRKVLTQQAEMTMLGKTSMQGWPLASGNSTGTNSSLHWYKPFPKW